MTTNDQHGMRVLVAGADEDGRSAIVSEQQMSLLQAPEAPEFWFAELFRSTESSAPPARRAGRLDIGIEEGRMVWQVIDYAPFASPPMHHTTTIDLDMVLQGSIELLLDDGAHVLEAGDAVIVPGVDHAWKAGPDGCRLSVTFLGTR